MRRGASKPSGDRAWNDFVHWCRVHRLRPLPAHPWTVAAYARSREHRELVSTIEHRLQQIARVHLLRCQALPHRHPMVDRTLRVIGSRQQSRSNSAALFFDGDFIESSDDTAYGASPLIKQKNKKNRARNNRID